ncbi:MAG: peptide ABC transporter permease, partial [Gammaproteobacteria bacterium]|nr:peptide ABC transporter permease [Gammaproteobacteria bacterium]
MFFKHNKVAQEFALQLESGAGTIEGRSLWQDAQRRFFRNKAAVVSLFIIGLVILFSIIGSQFAQYSYEEIDWIA